MAGGSRSRRRLTRRSSIPRSSTAPSLNAILTDSIGGPAPSQPMMNFYPPNGFPVALEVANASPLTSSTTSSTSKGKGKRKPGFKLNKDAAQQSPSEFLLPPATPTKAAKILGVPRELENVSAFPKLQHDSDLDGVNDDLPHSRYGWVQQHSAPLLSASTTFLTSKFQEEGVDADLSKSKKSWKKKAKDLLDSLTSPDPSPKTSAPRYSLAPFPLSSQYEEDTNYISRIGYNQPNYPLRDSPESSDPPVDPTPELPVRRRKQKKIAKPLEKMTPITEASNDDIGGAYRGGEDNTELDVISEYAHDDCHDAAMSTQSHIESPFVRYHGEYELEDDDLLYAAEDSETDLIPSQENEYVERPVTPVDSNEGNKQKLAAFHTRSPLQIVEDRLLDAAEIGLKMREYEKAKEQDSIEEEDYLVHGMPASLSKARKSSAAPVFVSSPVVEDRSLETAKSEIEERKTTLNKLHTRKLSLDEGIAILKASHEKMKSDFQEITLRDTAEEEDSEDNADLVSIRSSIDLDEEPTVHTAQAISFIRVTPGMVRLVDIPPRKGAENIKHKACKRQTLTREWVGAYDPAQQFPISEPIDQDVIRDREHPPAPFPKK
ncbi:hypothetical protein GQ44DRAFT_766554 [Phaeosphaeriaceae sp. PMI808]|nr:hypothetical protein GQ44DRAFT_766554 [Phaeosphaeriaceae sp. PMI808]